MNPAFNQFRNYCERFVQFLPEEFDFYKDKSDIITVKKKDIILASGEVEKYIYFIIEGTFRIYTQHNNREVSVEFGFPNNIISSYISYYTQEPSTLAIQALTDAKFIRLLKSDIDYFNNISKNCEHFTRKIMETLYICKCKKEILLLTHSAEERYLQLVHKHPLIGNTVPIKDLATYLGIQPESLSRIRRKIHNH